MYYFHPSFLFYGGLKLTREGTYGVGIVYLFEFVTIPLGIYRLFKEKNRYLTMLILWLLVGILPASLTNNEQHAGRTLVIYPFFVITSSIGLYHLVLFLKNNIRLIYIKLLSLLGIIFVLWNLLYVLITYSYIFPVQRGEDFMDGSKEAFRYAIEHAEEYDVIVVDPYRGVISPNIISIPHMYLLFFFTD